MISVKYTRNESGQITLERDLTEEEKNNLVSRIINVNTIDYYFKNDDRVLEKDSISYLKQMVISNIDDSVQNEIFKGFEYDGKLFSMSLSAQINWSNILNIPDSLFPLNVTTKDDSNYILTLPNRQSFYYAYLGYKYTCLNKGNALKTALELLTNESEILAFEIV